MYSEALFCTEVSSVMLAIPNVSVKREVKNAIALLVRFYVLFYFLRWCHHLTTTDYWLSFFRSLCLCTCLHFTLSVYHYYCFTKTIIIDRGKIKKRNNIWEPLMKIEWMKRKIEHDTLIQVILFCYIVSAFSCRSFRKK